MKRPIKQFLHYYIYDMKLKKKLALSFAILFMLPTLTVTFFLFTRIFRIVLMTRCAPKRPFIPSPLLRQKIL